MNKELTKSTNELLSKFYKPLTKQLKIWDPANHPVVCSILVPWVHGDFKLINHSFSHFIVNSDNRF